MPVFVRNLQLEFLTENGEFRSDRMLDMYGQARWRYAQGGYYLTYRMPSGVEFIFKAVSDGEDLRVVGTDTHVAGRCVWSAVPFMNVTPQSADSLSAVLAFTNLAQDGVFIAHLVNAAVLPTMEAGQSISMQMVAFPHSIAVYESREAYEQAAIAHDPDDSQPLILTDGRVFPLNFMLKNDPDVPEEERDHSLKDDLVLLCGRILAVEKRGHQDDDGEHGAFIIATIATQFGHLDVAFTAEMIGGGVCMKGQYLVFGGVLSGNVAIEGHENWLED